MNSVAQELGQAERAAPFRLEPAISLLAIIIAGCCAPLMVPELGFQYPHALFGASLTMSIGLVAGVVIAAIQRPASLLRAESILSFGLVYWVTLDSLQGAYPLYGATRESIQLAYVCLTIFAVGMWIGSMTGLSGRVRLSPGSMPELGATLIFWLIVLTFVFGTLRPVLACQGSLVCIAESFYASWDEVAWHAADFGAFGNVMKYLSYFGLLTLPMTAVLYRLDRRLSARVIIGFFLGTLVVVLLMQSGARRMVGVTVAASGLVWVLMHPRVGMRQLFRLGLLALLLLLMLEAMVSWRRLGLATAIAESAEVSGKGSGVLSVDKNMHYLTQAIVLVPERHPYAAVDGLLYVIGAPIPRSLWPGKPAHRGVDLVRLIGERKESSFSWTCSAICDFYLMGGVVPVALGGIFFGLLCNLVNRLLFRPVSVQARLGYAVGAMTLFIGLRVIRDLVAIGAVLLLLLWGLFFFRRLLFFLSSRPPLHASSLPQRNVLGQS